MNTETLLNTWRQIGYTNDGAQETGQTDNINSSDCIALKEPYMKEDEECCTDMENQTPSSDSYYLCLLCL